jgi:hypothetical protein
MIIKNINIHLGYLTGTAAAATAACMTAMGTLQNHINFTGVDNEIGFFLLTAGSATMMLILSFTKSK